MNISEIIKKSPRYLSSRYGSLRSYVQEGVYPQEYKVKILSKIKNKEQRKQKNIRMDTLVDEATALAFLFVIRKMFVEGSVATKNTVDTLKELGIDGLFLGRTEFTDRNSNVLLGDTLAEKITSTLDNETQTLLLNIKNVYEIVDYYKKKRNSENGYNYLFDQGEANEKLKLFFSNEKTSLFTFGNVINQVFEAYTFASTIKWYQKSGWSVDIISPIVKGKKVFRLKFSTKGAPNNYSYALCIKGEKRCQIRHQLRVSTRSYNTKNKYRANICCDIAIIEDIDLSFYFSDASVPNDSLISFGEVKHMSAYAELVAGFVGMVYELKPQKLKRIRRQGWSRGIHISPYLNVSGLLWHTARGLAETIEKREFDIDIYSFDRKMINL